MIEKRLPSPLPQQSAPSADQPDQRRRGFLKAVPLGAVAAVAGRATAAESAPVVATPAAQQASGYHETEHIRRYYRTAAYW
jgi:hypothetical protein